MATPSPAPRWRARGGGSSPEGRRGLVAQTPLGCRRHPLPNHSASSNSRGQAAPTTDWAARVPGPLPAAARHRVGPPAVALHGVAIHPGYWGAAMGAGPGVGRVAAAVVRDGGMATILSEMGHST